jgi:hypothetical protein
LRHCAGTENAQSCGDCSCYQSLANRFFHFVSPRVLNVINFPSLPCIGLAPKVVVFSFYIFNLLSDFQRIALSVPVK